MLNKTAFVLLIIGGLNWGLMGFFNYNLITSIFGDMTSITSLTSIIYDLIGLSALYVAFSGKRM